MRANSLVLELRLTLSYPAKPCPVVHDAGGTTVERVVLGRTGLEVSVAGLGCGGPSHLGQASRQVLDDLPLKLTESAKGPGFVKTICEARARNIDSRT